MMWRWCAAAALAEAQHVYPNVERDRGPVKANKWRYYCIPDFSRRPVGYTVEMTHCDRAAKGNVGTRRESAWPQVTHSGCACKRVKQGIAQGASICMLSGVARKVGLLSILPSALM
eukprot:1157831-Pelagomonas_calceolata.AAC.5